jgi:hypothetical protein
MARNKRIRHMKKQQPKCQRTIYVYNTCIPPRWQDAET